MKVMRKRKTAYNERCFVRDVQEQATTIRLFNKQVWVNLWDGRFGLLGNTGVMKTESIVRLYEQIQTVAVKDKIIARKDNPKQILKHLQHPYPLAKRA